jgi:hypothetical protein
MITYYGVYSLLVAIWVFKDAPQRNVSRWWALGTFILPLLVPYYIVKTRSSKSYWKYIGLWLVGFFVFHALGTAMHKIEIRNASDRPLSQSSGWKRFVPNDNRFAIHFPTQPSRKSEIVNTPDGKVELIQYMSKKGDVLYAVMYGDYPIKALSGITSEQLLDNARNGAAENVQGRILSEIVISKESCPGREFTIKVEPNTRVTSQIVLKDNRIYQIVVVTPSDKLFTSERRQFFDSFDILR